MDLWTSYLVQNLDFWSRKPIIFQMIRSNWAMFIFKFLFSFQQKQFSDKVGK